MLRLLRTQRRTWIDGTIVIVGRVVCFLGPLSSNSRASPRSSNTRAKEERMP